MKCDICEEKQVTCECMDCGMKYCMDCTQEVDWCCVSCLPSNIKEI